MPRPTARLFHLILCLALAGCVLPNAPTLALPTSAAVDLTPFQEELDRLKAEFEQLTTPIDPAPGLLPTLVPTETPVVETEPQPLPASPVVVDFNAEDGQALQGTYYPAAQNPAPVMVVFFHWIKGDQHDFDALALRLQNRAGQSRHSGGTALVSRRALAAPLSAAVFTFTFRNCAGGCNDLDPEGWKKDAAAAISAALALNGIDPLTRVLAVGSSIGADAGAWVCGNVPGCAKVLAFSPGSYLGVTFEALADSLSQQKIPLDCYTSTGDQPAVEACQKAGEKNANVISTLGTQHGNELMDLFGENLIAEITQLAQEVDCSPARLAALQQTAADRRSKLTAVELERNRAADQVKTHQKELGIWQNLLKEQEQHLLTSQELRAAVRLAVQQLQAGEDPAAAGEALQALAGQVLEMGAAAATDTSRLDFIPYTEQLQKQASQLVKVAEGLQILADQGGLSEALTGTLAGLLDTTAASLLAVHERTVDYTRGKGEYELSQVTLFTAVLTEQEAALKAAQTALEKAEADVQAYLARCPQLKSGGG